MLRFLLRIAAVLLVAGAAYLVVWQPNANVAGADLLTKVSITVQCSSLWDQWTHHAHPAALDLNGKAVVNLQAAQSSCQSASSKIKRIAAGMTVGALVAVGTSFLFRRSRR
jgi:hypothetical protein